MGMITDLFSLQDQVVVLTGGSGLIGREAVKQLPETGCQLVVGVRDTGRFEAQLAANDYPESAARPVCLPLDVADPDSIKAFFQALWEKYGRLDGLINNAWPRTADWLAKFEDVTPESLYKNLCDHSGGFFLCCQSAAEYMKRQQRGAIVNMGSIYGEVGPHFPIYQGTDMTCPGAYPLIKGGIHTFTKYLATYLAPWNIRVNCISPGGVADDTHQHTAFQQRYIAQTPLGRMGRPIDLVGPMLFFLAPASGYVTGTRLQVDGGWTAW